MTSVITFMLDNFDILTSEATQIPALRQTILELVMRGKLTQQDPNDEPASELIARIKAEKKEANDKSLPPIGADEMPFVLPKSWEWTRLGEITNYGSSVKRNVKDVDDSIWVLDLEDIEK